MTVSSGPCEPCERPPVCAASWSRPVGTQGGRTCAVSWWPHLPARVPYDDAAGPPWEDDGLAARSESLAWEDHRCSDGPGPVPGPASGACLLGTAEASELGSMLAVRRIGELLSEAADRLALDRRVCDRLALDRRVCDQIADQARSQEDPA